MPPRVRRALVRLDLVAFAALFALLAACGGAPPSRSRTAPPAWEDAGRAFEKAASDAVRACRREDAPTVLVGAVVVFTNDGHVAEVDAHVPMADAPAVSDVKECVVSLLLGMRVASFEGNAMPVSVTLVVRPEDPPSTGGSKPDTRAAEETLAYAARKVKSTCVGHGRGRVKVLFDPDGVVRHAVVDSTAHAGTDVAACVEALYSSCRIPAFGTTGGAVFLHHFELDAD